MINSKWNLNKIYQKHWLFYKEVASVLNDDYKLHSVFNFKHNFTISRNLRCDNVFIGPKLYPKSQILSYIE